MGRKWVEMIGEGVVVRVVKGGGGGRRTMVKWS